MKKLILLLLCLGASRLCMAQTPGAQTFYNDHYLKFIKATGYGDILTGNAGVVNLPIGSDNVHIFFDEYGNLITRNLPNGVPWINYIIHIIHSDANYETYGIVQTSGSITGQIVINNSSASANIQAKFLKSVPTGADYSETISQLNPSDKNDISFQLIKTVVDPKTNNATKATIGTYTITMTGYFNASIDVGILNSKLHNPTYSLVNSPTTAGAMVVKSSNNDDRVMTTIMGTIYFSPFSYFEKYILKQDIPKFKLKGRSSIADHSLIERIYPTFGLSINENTFQNIFYGFNWEIIRGGSLFLGWHTGKINVYNSASNFKFGEIAVTTDQFNLNTDTKWSTKFAVGATIDLKVVLGLLSTSVK